MLDSPERGKDKVIPFIFGFIPTEKVWFESMLNTVGIYFLVVQHFMEGIGLALQLVELFWNRITDLNMK